MLFWVIGAVLAAGILIALYAIFIERRWFRLARYRLDILPPDHPTPLTILHVSDLHLLRRDRRMPAFLATLPRADLVVATGDLLGEPEAVKATVAAIRPLRGRLASLFVLGSNDLYAPRFINYLRYFVPSRKRKRRLGPHGRAADLVRLLEADGWVHLKNRKYDRRAGDLPLEIVGLDDPHIHRGDLRAAPRTNPDAFGLAVVHSPDPAPELVALGYDLVVAGHTHGGQVRMPLIGALVSNCTIPARMTRGLFRVGPGYLHVSGGLGTSKFAPFRLLCRPEASLLELHPAPADATAQPETIRSNTAS